MIERLHDDRVGDHIKLLLDLALHIRRPLRPEDIGEPREPDLAGNHLRRDRKVVQDPGERPGGLWEPLLLLDDEAIDRDDRDRRILDHEGTLRDWACDAPNARRDRERSPPQGA